MLDAVSSGLHASAVISQLAGKFNVSKRCLRSDWERREKWVPVLLSLEKYAGFCETVEEAKDLLGVGFNFILEKNDIMLFRRPKRFAGKP